MVDLEEEAQSNREQNLVEQRKISKSLLIICKFFEDFDEKVDDCHENDDNVVNDWSESAF